VGEKQLNTSFRWGKGLAIRSADKIDVFATDRNVFPLSSIPSSVTSKDFSLMTWQSS
jgi:hypothetical protein